VRRAQAWLTASRDAAMSAGCDEARNEDHQTIPQPTGDAYFNWAELLVRQEYRPGHALINRVGKRGLPKVRFPPDSDIVDISASPSGATMYGPAVRSKMEFREGERESCINVFGL
jgi:hypothetical protein